LAGWIQVYVSNALAYEYADVLSRKLSESRWQRIKPVLGTLLSRTQFVTIYYSWRPISPDPGDEHVIDCAMNAGAIVVTSNVRDFRAAEESLGLRVATPVEVVIHLTG
jgi:predicted nucleic acid-binding protein